MRKKTLALMVGLMATLTIEGGLHAQSRFKTGGDKLPKMMKESEKLSIPPNDIRKDYPLLLTAKPTGRNPFKTPGSILGTPKYRICCILVAIYIVFPVSLWGLFVLCA